MRDLNSFGERSTILISLPIIFCSGKIILLASSEECDPIKEYQYRFLAENYQPHRTER